MAQPEFNAAARQRLLELLPFYLNGRIAEADRTWVDDLLAREPVARQELAFHQGVADDVKARIDALPSDAGLERLMARVREDLAGGGAADPARPVGLVGQAGAAGVRRGPGPLQRLGDFFASLTPRPAFAMAAAVIAAQAGVIGMLLTQAPQDEYATVRSVRQAAPASVGNLAVLAVSFKAEATERQIRLLLLAMGGTLVGGPGQLGEYRVAVPEPRLEAARAEAAASPVVESVSLAKD